VNRESSGQSRGRKGKSGKHFGQLERLLLVMIGIRDSARTGR
jgi:hypothetical protein